MFSCTESAICFCIPVLRKFHPRTLCLEYKVIVQSQMRNRVEMNQGCYVTGRKCGSWEGLQNGKKENQESLD